MTSGQSFGVEKIVRSCIESAAHERDIPDSVIRRLIRVADALASGEIKASQRSELYRRLELVIQGFGTENQTPSF